MSQLQRKMSVFSTVTVLFLVVASANGQPPGQRTMGQYGWRWHAPVQFDNNVTFNLPVSVSPWPYWGYGGFWGYGNPYAIQPAYGIPAYGSLSYGLTSFNGMGTVRSQRPVAAVSPPPSYTYEQSLLSQVRSIELRRQLRKAVDERNAEEAEERRSRSLARPDKRPTDLYARLSAEQLDFSTGVVSWPESLLRDEFAEDRNSIEAALSSMAEHGPDELTAADIRETANQMKKTTNSLLSELGFETYTETRRFLSSLSVEGYYALENQ